MYVQCIYSTYSIWTKQSRVPAAPFYQYEAVLSKNQESTRSRAYAAQGIGTTTKLYEKLKYKVCLNIITLVLNQKGYSERFWNLSKNDQSTNTHIRTTFLMRRRRHLWREGFAIEEVDISQPTAEMEERERALPTEPAPQ